MADPPVKQGDILAGKYQVERVLGSGGMGVVVAAWHQELEQRVAVKFLLPEIAERTDAAERFRREARAAVKIRSEHVARVIDVGTLDGIAPYMVMEYLDGHDLAEEIRLRRLMPIPESLDYMLQACEAVAEAHSFGIVHRDLKPANLFLTRRSDGTRVVKVLDFGISKSVLGGSVNDLSLTRTSSLIGSPLYMSPEQMKSARDVDARTDIWAIGTILFEMLAGRPPYVAESIPQLCAALLSEAPPPLSDFRADVPPALEAILLRCLAKDRAQRWPTIAEFAQNLAAYAPASARIHADRARRVLGSTEVSIGQPTVGSFNVPGSTVMSTGASAMSASDASKVPTGPGTGSGPVIPPRTGATLASWGGTQDPEARSAVARRRIWLAASGFGLLLVAALVIFIVKTRTVNEPAVPMAAAQTAAAVAPETPAPLAAGPEIKPVPETVPGTLPSAAISAQAGSAVGAAAAAASKRPPRGGRFPVPPTQQNRPGPSTISDFGGRR